MSTQGKVKRATVACIWLTNTRPLLLRVHHESVLLVYWHWLVPTLLSAFLQFMVHN